MADIKQAAKWMQEGKVVHRVSADADSSIRYMYNGDWFVADDLFPEFEVGIITLTDILAEDWELFPIAAQPASVKVED